MSESSVVRLIRLGLGDIRMVDSRALVGDHALHTAACDSRRRT